MPRESKENRTRRARRIAKKLFAAHPDATIALEFRNPFELICATVLSAAKLEPRNVNARRRSDRRSVRMSQWLA